MDTEPIYTQVTQTIVARFGKTFDWSIKANMIGRSEMDSARYLVDTLELPITAEEYLTERNGLLKAGFAQCRAMPGAKLLIRSLHQHGIPMAIATSSSQELFQVKITRHADWINRFSVIVTGDDPEVHQAKPAPDLFVVAAQRLGTNPETTLVFEDAPSGLAAGIAAKMRVIVVPDPNMDPARYTGAEEILQGLPCFAPGKYGLPESIQPSPVKQPVYPAPTD